MSFSSNAPLVANQVSDTDFPDNFTDFHEVFDREFKKITDAINTKEGALYLLQELATFQQYFNPNNVQENLNVYRITVNFGALPNADTKRVSHGIAFDSNTRLTRMYGAATDTARLQYLPLPFSSPILINNVTLEADGDEILITTGTDYSNYTYVTVVMEYTKGTFS